MITVTLLGNSALLPLPDRAETAATLHCGGRTILLDCGEGTQTAARRAGVSLMKTDLIALTHYHGDHIFGLPGLMQTMSCLGRTEPLYITGPAGLEEILTPILTLTGPTAYPVQALPLPADGLELSALHPGWPAGARLRAFPTLHRVPSQGYCFSLPRAGRFLPQRAKELGIPQCLWGQLQKGKNIENAGHIITPEMVLDTPRKGLKVVFSGDTAACPALVKAAAGADLLICEGTYGENEQAQLAMEHGHMNFAQAARVAAEAQAKELWLTHFSQRMETPEEFLPLAQAFFPGAVCGVDGKTETLQFEGEK